MVPEPVPVVVELSGAGTVFGQMVCVAGPIAPEVGAACTVILKFTEGPVQPLARGVTTMVAVPATGVKAGMEVTPVWLGNPMAVPPEISKTTPEGVPVSEIGADNIPLQNVWSAGMVAEGIGLMRMV